MTKSKISFALLALTIFLSGCSLFESDKAKPLPGERFTVLPEKEELKPSDNAQEKPLDLIAASDNADWPQTIKPAEPSRRKF